MSAMKAGLPWLLAWGLVGASACSSEYGESSGARKLIEVQMSVTAWNDAGVGVVLIDRSGRRTGWNVDRPIDEIPGCGYEAGSDEGIPDYWWLPDDTTEVALPETVGVDTAIVRVPAPQPTPMFHHFNIVNDILTPVGLIDQGGCELRLDSVVGGKVQLWLSATGVGFNMCKDTTSVWVRPGVPLRWRLSWKATGDKCIVKIARLRGREPTKSSGR